MRNDQIFVLLLVILLPMSGCFDGAVGDAEGTDDASSGTTVINNYYNNTSTNSDLQERTWYSSGGTYQQFWNDDTSAQNGEVNYFWNNDEMNGYSNLSDWDLTGCEGQGGNAYFILSNGGTGYERDYIYCDVTFATVNTMAGEALLIYEARALMIETTCENVTITTSSVIEGEFDIASGSSMDCQHRLYRTLSYGSDDSVTFWSIVYAIQETTVV
jgi:hypothetical protein